MKKITNRLAHIAQLIGMGKTVADIGTDHGFLPIYLQKEYASPYVVLTDISKASLQKAIDNVNISYESADIKKYFDFRCGSGIEVLKPAEVDAVVFAGMGGELMADLLSCDIKKTQSFSKFIFQPRTGQGFLRYWLQSNNFEIQEEVLVVEGKFICEIIGASYVKKEVPMLEPFVKNAVKYEITPKMLTENPELGLSFLNCKIKKENSIKVNLENMTTENIAKKEQNYQNLQYLYELLKEFKS